MIQNGMMEVNVALNWKTDSQGITTFGFGSGGLGHISCSPNTWNGAGDFTTTCTVTK